MRGWAPLLLVVLAFSRPVLAEEATSIHRVAFLVGANDGGQKRVRLHFAESDARAMSNVLETLGGVAPRDRLLLLNPSRTELVAGLEHVRELLNDRPPEVKRTELFVYYSGHSDEDGLMLGEDRLEYGEFRRTIESLPADVRVVILDSCDSGAMTRVKGGVKRPAFMVDDATKVEGHAILTSSAADEAAQESDRVGGSFFTHYLISGLRGAADTTHDGRVTLNEAYQFAFNETLARTEQTSSGAQHPGYDIQLLGTGDLVITDLRGSTARLVLPAPMDGRVYVRDADGHLAAELRKLPGRPVDLGLDPGTYTLTLIEQSNEAFGATVTLSDGRRTEVARLEPLSRELAIARGGPFINQYNHVPVAVGILPGFSSTSTVTGKVATNALLNLPFGHVDSVAGVQVGVVSRTTDDVRGVDAALGGSWISHNLYGVQASGGFNVANAVSGAQVSVGFNSAQTLHGVQIGLINFGGDIAGTQIGLINIASHVTGTQLGLINIADEVEGLPVGLFSYSQKGMLHLDVWASDSAPLNVGLKASGGKYVYTLLAIAPLNQSFYSCLCKSESTYPFPSFGVGVQIPFKQFYGAVDLSGGPEIRTVGLPGSLAHYEGQNGFDRDFSGLFKLRGIFGWQPYNHFAIFGGVGANAYITPVDGGLPSIPAGWGPHIFVSGTTRSLTIWPGVFSGFQF